MPDLPRQDDRGPVGPPAPRAAGSPSPVARRPRVIIISGPSGAGKGTLIERVLPGAPHVALAVSATTRRRRPGEVDGRDYHFLTEDSFGRAVADGRFIEHVTYAGNRYGTLRSEIHRRLDEGLSVILEIELEGARALKAELPDAVSIFIAPPSMDELSARLRRRGTDSPDEIERRLATGRDEVAAMREFDRRIVNTDVETAARELAEILDAATRAPA